MKTPYLQVVGMPREMRGEGAPRPTVFGVLGMTKESGKMRSLGGLVENSKASHGIFKGTLLKHAKVEAVHSERGAAGGPPSKTHIAKEHYAQVPYPGRFMSPAGPRL